MQWLLSRILIIMLLQLSNLSIQIADNYICIPKDQKFCSPMQHLQASTLASASQAAMETWDETGVNRIRAEKKLKAGN